MPSYSSIPIAACACIHSFSGPRSRLARQLPGILAYLSFIRRSILFVHGIRVCVGRRGRVWVVEEGLDADEDFLDGDGRAPAFIFVEDGEADGPGWVYVWMEEWGDEFA